MKILWALVILVGALLLILILCDLTTGHGNRVASDPSSLQGEGGTLELDQASSSAKPAVSVRQIGRARHEAYIVIDRYTNRLLLRTKDSVLLDALCSTGSGAELTDSLTGRHWRFLTPAGVYLVHSMIEQPWWRKPDWAFVEEGIPLPERESERLDNEMMGDYAIGFGDGYFVHGTIYERLLGKAVTHGCVRMGSDDLKILYGRVHIGTLIFVI